MADTVLFVVVVVFVFVFVLLCVVVVRATNIVLTTSIGTKHLVLLLVS